MMKTFNIIALCGYKSSGKDHIANYIVDKYDYEHKKIAFKLKEIIKFLFDLNDEQIEGNMKEACDENWGTSPRKMMQFIGTDIFQYKISELLPGCKKNFWIKSLCNDIKNSNKKNIVISDLRFIHEYNYLIENMSDYNIITVEVCNSNIIKNDLHISESEYKNIPKDFIVHNNKVDDEFKKSIDNILKCKNN